MNMNVSFYLMQRCNHRVRKGHRECRKRITITLLVKSFGTSCLPVGRQVGLLINFGNKSCEITGIRNIIPGGTSGLFFERRRVNGEEYR